MDISINFLLSCRVVKRKHKGRCLCECVCKIMLRERERDTNVKLVHHVPGLREVLWVEDSVAIASLPVVINLNLHYTTLIFICF